MVAEHASCRYTVYTCTIFDPKPAVSFDKLASPTDSTVMVGNYLAVVLAVLT